jgi:hypothetical protein
MFSFFFLSFWLLHLSPASFFGRHTNVFLPGKAETVVETRHVFRRVGTVE